MILDGLRVRRREERSFDRDLGGSHGNSSGGAKMNRARSADDILDDSCHGDVDLTSPPPKPPLDLSGIKLLTMHRFVGSCIHEYDAA